jgi:ketosteroid isomerase-like protein
MPLDQMEAAALARDWIEAFNAKDLERILSHYAANVELVSPVYLRFTGGKTDRLQGRDALRSYFSGALELHPQLRFTLLEVAAGATSVVIRYHTSLGDQIAMECLEIDEQRRATRVLCHYAPRATSG